jgi:hypothetical protein
MFRPTFFKLCTDFTRLLLCRPNHHHLLSQPLGNIMKHVYITKSCNYNDNNFYERSQLKLVCMHAKIRNLLKGFKLNIILGSFTNIYTHIPILVKIGQQQWEFYMKTYKRLCAEWSGEEKHLKVTWDSSELQLESLVGLATTPGNSPWWRQQPDTPPTLVSLTPYISDVIGAICECQRSNYANAQNFYAMRTFPNMLD